MLFYFAKWVPEFSTKIQPLMLTIFLQFHFLLKLSTLKPYLRNSPQHALIAFREGLLLTVECDASEHSLGETLGQNGLSVSFQSCTFTAIEKRYSVIKKEAALIDAVNK